MESLTSWSSPSSCHVALLSTIFLSMVSDGGSTPKRQTHKGTCPQGDPPSGSRLDWAACKQFRGCSCCTASDVHVLHTAHKGLTASLSPACAEAWEMHVCRPCDPLVGTRARTRVCLGYCQAFFVACTGDYFAYDTISGKIVPCRQDSLLCSPLGDMVPNGTGLCKEFGLKEALPSSLNCYNGSAPPPLDSCSEVYIGVEQATVLWLLFRVVAPLACMAIMVCGVWVLRRGQESLSASGGARQQQVVTREQAEHVAMLEKRMKKFAVH